MWKKYLVAYFTGRVPGLGVLTERIYRDNTQGKNALEIFWGKKSLEIRYNHLTFGLDLPTKRQIAVKTRARLPDSQLNRISKVPSYIVKFIRLAGVR